MGFRVVDERTYRIEPGEAGAAEVWMHDMMLERADGAAFDLEALKARLEAVFMAVMRGRAENDGYNALVLSAGVQWRDVALVRTISRYLRQIRIAYSQDYMWATLRRHHGIAAQIVTLFHTRFDPRIEIATKSAPRGRLRCWPRSRPRWVRWKASMKTASCVISSMP